MQLRVKNLDIKKNSISTHHLDTGYKFDFDNVKIQVQSHSAVYKNATTNKK